MEDKITNLYNAFVNEGYEMEPEEEFRENLKDESKRRAAYDALVSDGYDMEPYEAFEVNIGFGEDVQGLYDDIETDSLGNESKTARGIKAWDSGIETAPEMKIPSVAAAASYSEGSTPITQQDKIAGAAQVDDILSRFKNNGGAVMDAAQRIVDRDTPEGREQRKSAEFTARLHGVDTQLMGRTAQVENSEQSESSESSEATEKPRMLAPVVDHIEYDDDGNAVPVWQLADGTLTKDRLAADRQQRQANRDRLDWENMQSGMRRVGLNPDSEEDRAAWRSDAPIFELLQDEWDAANEKVKAAEEQYKRDAGISDNSARSIISNFNPEEVSVMRADANRLRYNMERNAAMDLPAMAKRIYNALPEDYRVSLVERFSKELGAEVPGMSAAELKAKAESRARNYIYHSVVDKAAGTMRMSGGELFMRKVADGNILSSAYSMNAAASAMSGSSGLAAAEEQAMAKAAEDNKVADIAGTVVGMAVDPVTHLAGGVGGAAFKGAVGVLGRLGGSHILPQIATKIAGSKLGGKLIGGVVAGGANFGTYEAVGEALSQVEHAGVIDAESGENGGFSPMAVLERGGHGVVIGAATGAVTPMLGNYADKMVLKTKSLPGKVGIRTAQTATSTVLEGTIFSVPEWIEGERRPMDVWTDNMALAFGFKFSHALKSAPTTLARMRAQSKGSSLTFAEVVKRNMDLAAGGDAYNTDERVRSMANVRLSADELGELRELGYGNLADIFRESTSDKARDHKVAVGSEAEAMNAYEGFGRLSEVMDDSRASLALRAKLHFLATGHILPATPIVGSRIYHDERGWKVESVDSDGNVVTSRRYSSESRAKEETETINRQAELNAIGIGEQYADEYADRQLAKQGCEAVAQEMDMPIETVARIYADSLKGAKQTPETAELVGKVLSYMEAHKEDVADLRVESIRSRIETEHDASVEEALNKPQGKREEAERAVVAEYLKALYPEEGATEAEGGAVTVRAATEDAYERGRAAYKEAVMTDVADTAETTDGHPELDDIYIRYRDAYDALADILDEADFYEVSDEPIAALARPEFAEYQYEILEYANAKAAYDGVNDADGDAKEMKRAAAKRDIKNRTHKDSGMIVPATMKVDDRPVYIVKGDVQMYSDGSGVDIHNSSDSVIICDAESGELKMVSPDAIFKVGEPLDAQTELERVLVEIESEPQPFDRAVAAAETGTSAPEAESKKGEENSLEIISKEDENELPLQQEKSETDEVSERIPQTSNGAQDGETSTLARAIHALAPRTEASVGGSGSSALDTQDGGSRPDVSRQELEARKAESFAKENGLWIPFEEAFELGRPGKSGNENETYVSDDGTYYKVNNLMNSGGEISTLLERIRLHNEIFPETAYELHGFTGFDGRSIFPILKQRGIEGESASPAEIEDYIKSLGFERVDEHTYRNGEYVVSDLRPRNVLKDFEGDIYVIDADIRRAEAVAETGSALSCIPMEGDEPQFTKVDAQMGWDGLVEAFGGREQDATEVVMAQIEQARSELEKLKKKSPTLKEPSLKGSPMSMIKAKRDAQRKYEDDLAAYNQQLEKIQHDIDAWTAISGVGISRAAEAQAAAEAKRQAENDAEHDAATRRFEEKQRIKAEKEAEQAAIGTHAVNPKIKAKWDNAPKVEGNADAITLPDGSTIRGRYILTEARAASASHDVNNAYAPTEGFPVDENGQSVNDRDYQRDRDAQRIVEDMAGAFDNRALQSPIIVSRDGVVLSGNNRTMSGDLAAARGTDKAYVGYLREFSNKYGFTPEQVGAMKNPRVVFVPDEELPYNAATFARFNAQEMKSQSKPEAAVKLGKVVPEEVFNSIVADIARYDRLSDYYADERAVAQALGALQAAGVINDKQMPELRTGTALSAAGKELLENTLIGKVFQASPDAVRDIVATPTLRQSVVMGLGEIAANRTLADSGYDLSEELSRAVALVARAKASMPDIYKEGVPVSPFGRQQGLFDDEMGDSRVTDAIVLMLADTLNSGKPSDLRKFLLSYNSNAAQSAAGQMDIFSGDVQSKEDILTQAINHFRNATPKEQQALVDKLIADRKQRAEGQRATGQELEQTPDGIDGGATGEPAGTAGRNSERTDNLQQKETNPQVTCELSDDVNEFGKPFVKSSNGTTDFGFIDEESGLTPLPIRLNLGENHKDEEGRNRGFGYLHIDAGHREEILQNGFSSVEEFVESVAKNYTDIREGARIGENQTYLLEVSDEHNNTLFIQLSRDSKYWNVNSAGIFKKKYSRRKPKVYSKPAVGDGTATDTIEVNSGKNEVATAPAGNSSETSGDKGNALSVEKQEAEGKSLRSEPTEAQKLAGNYKKKHVRVDGHEISIENEKGTVRRGKDADGTEWATEMHNDYGYIRGTEGVDGDHIDVYLSDTPEQGDVFVVDQYNPDGTFDEHKVMYGFPTEEAARKAYLSNYEEGWENGRRLDITHVSKDEFDKWVESSKRKTKPFAEYKSVKTIEGELGRPSPYLISAGFPNLPISMRASLLRLKSGMGRHPFNATELAGLVKSLQKPVAIFEYTKDNIRNIIADVMHDGKHFLIGVTLNYEAGGVEINSVSGLFPKESHEWLKWIQDGKVIRIDQKEKVQQIIDSLRMNPGEAERIGLNLDTVAKIVKKHENPPLPDAENSIEYEGVRYRTSEEIDREYPNWLEGTTTESGKHSTQVEGTRKTYGKVGDWIEEHLGKEVSILDASSGMGYGTADLRERGFDIEDVEPYQSEQRKTENPATYDSYSAIDKKYDVVISNAVLNVIPDDWRRDVLHDMAIRLNDGGMLFINTRKAGEEKAIKDKIELDSPQEVLVKRNGKIASYQRFYTPGELRDWVAEELGEGYEVEIANEKNSGTKGLAAVVVKKTASAEAVTERSTETDKRERAESVGGALGSKVRVVTDVEEIVDDNAMVQARKRGSKGWYDTATGEVVVVLGNHRDAADVEATVIHELVGHDGIRMLFPTKEKLDNALDELYRVSDDGIRRAIEADVQKAFDADIERLSMDEQFLGEDITPGSVEAKAKAAVEAHRRRKAGEYLREATEEYGARVAEKVGTEGFEKMSEQEMTFWGKLKSMLEKAFDRLCRGLKIGSRRRWTDKEWAYVYHKAYKAKKAEAEGMDKIIAEAEDALMRRNAGWDADMQVSPKRVRIEKLRKSEAIEVTDEMLPEGLDLNNRKAVQVSLRANIRGEYANDDTGDKLTVSGRGINEVTHHGMSDEAHVKSLFAIPEMLKRAIFIDEQANEKGTTEYDSYKYYVCGLKIDGEDYTAKIVVGVKNGQSYYDHRLSQIEKGKLIDSLNAFSNGVAEKQSPSNGYKGMTLKRLLQIPEKENADLVRFRDGDMSLEELMTKMKTDAMQANADNLQAKRDAMRAIGGNLNHLRQAMARQREYDITTVKSVTDLARVLMNAGLLDDMSKNETKRILGAIDNVVGRQDVSKYVQKIMDIMVDSQLRTGANAFGKLVSIRGSRVDSRGIEVQGELDASGQTMIKAFKKAISIPITADEDGLPVLTHIDGEIEDALKRMESDVDMIADTAAAEYAGLMLAKEYAETIGARKLAKRNHRKALSEAEDKMRAGEMDANAFRQFADAIEDEIKCDKVEMAQAYFDLVAKLSDSLRESIEKARAFKDAEKERIAKIHHLANADMEGRPLKGQRDATRLQKIMNNKFVRLPLEPLSTFDQMLKMFGSHNSNGQGYLHDYFMRSWIDSVDKEQTLKEKYHKQMDDKAAEIFGKRNVWWNGGIKSVAYGFKDLYEYADVMKSAYVTYHDGVEMREYELSQGVLLSLYAVDKMPLGRATNRNMGITDEVMEQITEALDPKLKAYADWVQEEFLPGVRIDIDEVYVKIQGAHLDDIENYFPFLRDKYALKRNVQNGQQSQPNDRVGVMGAGLFKKRVNSVSTWDIPSYNFFDVLARHIEDAAHDTAYAEFNRDIGTLLSYNHFQQQVMAMSSVYGSGKELLQRFKEVCAIAADCYEPKRATFDAITVQAAKGVTMGKIAYRTITAVKQVLSMPAFFGEVSPQYIAEDLAMGGIPALQWSWKNMPNFRKRLLERTAGDYRLRENEYDNRIMKAVWAPGKIGMLPNIAVDAWTIAIGAHGHYQTMKAKYLRWGMDESKAEKRAIQDAELCFNKSQQSSEGALMAPIQVDHTLLSTGAMLFRNSSTSYSREAHNAARNLKRIISGEVNVDFMAKQWLRMMEVKTFGQRFDEELAQQVAGTLPVGHIYQLGKPGGILQSAQIQDLPIELSAERLALKASESYRSSHPFPLEAVRNLPQAINNPIAVFDSATRDGAKVILTTLRHRGHNFVVAMEAQRTGTGRAERLEVNNILSLYPKDSIMGIMRWIANGHMAYCDHKKMRAFFSVQWPDYIVDGENALDIVIRPKDQQRINLADVDSRLLEDAAKIVNEFDNPAIPTQKSNNEWSEEDWSKARKIAREEIRHDIVRNGVNLVMFGWILPWLWRIGGIAIALSLTSDNDEKQKQIADRTKNSYFAPIEGLAYGDVINDILTKKAGLVDMRWRDIGRGNPLFDDLQQALMDLDKDFIVGCNDVFNIIGGMATGVNPQTITDWVVAIMDASDDNETRRETALLIARILNAPQSQIDKIYFDELGATGEEVSKMTPAEIAERYAEYKTMRNAPLTGWAYSDEARDSVMTSHTNKALKIAKGKVEERVATEATRQLMAEYEEYNAYDKELKAKKKGGDREGYLKGIRELRDSGALRRHDRVKRYRRDIKEMTEQLLRSKSASECDSLVRAMIECRDRMLRDVQGSATDKPAMPLGSAKEPAAAAQ